jgi:hypothetical protein
MGVFDGVARRIGEDATLKFPEDCHVADCQLHNPPIRLRRVGRLSGAEASADAHAKSEYEPEYDTHQSLLGLD